MRKGEESAGLPVSLFLSWSSPTHTPQTYANALPWLQTAWHKLNLHSPLVNISFRG